MTTPFGDRGPERAGISFAAAPTRPAEAEVLAVPVFAGGLLPGDALGRAEVDFLAAVGFEAGVGEAVALPGDGAVVVAVGLGEPEAATPDTWRRAAAAAVREAWRARSVAFALPAGDPDPSSTARAVVEGAALAAYRFTRYKQPKAPCRIEWFAVVGEGLEAGVEQGRVVAEAVAFARDLVNEPPGAMTPAKLAEVAESVAEAGGLGVRVLDEAAIEAEGLGGLRGVSLGSDQPPRLVELTYDPGDTDSGDTDRGDAVATVVVVGKGITFDSGGLSIKTAEGMMTMKTDMSGAAAVLATMSALPKLEPRVKVKVVGIVPATENMPGGRATKPGDVLTIRNGTTVEVLNTDAEGRLVLADGLSLAVEHRPDAIVDLATLTGACVVALGREVAGLMGNSDDLVAQVRDAGERAGEPAWHLPLPSRYRKHIDSDVADVKNIGTPGQAGTLVAGLFLQEFVGDVPWAHLDIAGPARAEADDGYVPKGGTGVGVRTLLELLSTFRPPRRSGTQPPRRSGTQPALESSADPAARPDAERAPQPGPDPSGRPDVEPG